MNGDRNDFGHGKNLKVVNDASQVARELASRCSES